MARFMLVGKYTAEGLAATRKEGLTARTKAVKRAVESLGGKFVGQYWTTGPDDALVIADFPDATGAIAIATTAKSAGVAEVSIVRLFDGPEFDAIAVKAAKMKYTPPSSGK